ncbi:putative RNA polymerase II subunit B1 CTD phosphatase RPAP2, partial [Ophiophagus hannah]
MSCPNIIHTTLLNPYSFLRKAALEAAIRKKIECERKALQVVEQLLEDDITEEFFVDCGRLVTPSHYQDVVEERFIMKICGYPLCQNKLQNVRVYAREITVVLILSVGSSVFAATFVTKHQNTLRAKYPKLQCGFEKKKDLKLELSNAQRPPTIQLLKEDSSGYSGKEIKLVSERIKSLDIENPTPAEIHHDYDSGSESNSDAEQEFVSSVLQENLSNTEKLAKKPLKSILKKSSTKRAEPKLFTPEDTLEETSAQLSKGTSDGNIQGEEPCHSQNVLENVQVSENLGNNSSCSQVVFLGVSQKGADQFKRLLAQSKLSVRSPANSLAAKDSLLESLWKTFTEWRSEETLKFLHGSCSTSIHLLQHTQPNDSEKEQLDEDDLENASSGEAVSQKHNLNSLDQSLPFQDSRTAAKPLPSFENLKKGTLQLELKVSEFYKGKFTVIEEEDLAMQSEREQQNGKSQVSILKIKEVVIMSNFGLPAVLGPLKIPFGDVYSELRNLVKTFRLTNTNIIHKAPVWTLITIVMLSIVDLADFSGRIHDFHIQD